MSSSATVVQMKLSEPRLLSIETKDGTLLVPCFVNRIKGSRHVKLLIDYQRRLHLRIPFRTAERDALDFFRKQGDWIESTLANAPKPLTLYQYLQKRPRLAADGKWWIVRFIRESTGAKCGWRFAAQDDVVEFNIHEDQDDPSRLGGALRNFAKAVLPHRVARLLDASRPIPSRITVRDQRSRWGSCSSAGAISLNWRLILLPPALQDYVILHEIAHLRHHNHSSRFWNYLEELDPKAREHDDALSQMSSRVMSLVEPA